MFALLCLAGFGVLGLVMFNFTVPGCVVFCLICVIPVVVLVDFLYVGGKHQVGWGLPSMKRGEGLFIMLHLHVKLPMMPSCIIAVPYGQGSSSKDYTSWCC